MLSEETERERERTKKKNNIRDDAFVELLLKRAPDNNYYNL